MYLNARLRGMAKPYLAKVKNSDNVVHFFSGIIYISWLKLLKVIYEN